MQLRSKILLFTAAVLAVALVVYLIATAPRPSDQRQIADAIETARAAAERRSAVGILTVVSADYKDPALANVDQLHVLLVQTFRNTGPIQVQTDGSSVKVTGDTAESVSHLTIRNGGATYFQGNIVLDWKREPSHRFLIFPSTTWRIVSAQYPGMSSMMPE